MFMAISHSCDGHPPPSGSADGRRPRIAIAMEGRYLAQPQPAGLAVALAIGGHAPILLDPETSGGACLRHMDLLVVRGRSPALLDLLELAESLEVPVVNRRRAIASVLDKARMARALATAGLHSPATRVGTLRALADRSSASDFPMVVKPVRGDDARAVHVVRSHGELLALRGLDDEDRRVVSRRRAATDKPIRDVPRRWWPLSHLRHGNEDLPPLSSP